MLDTTGAPEAPPRRGPRALSHAQFRRLWMGGFVSTAGTQMQSVAIAYHVYQLTHSPLAAGLLGACKAVPLASLALTGGAVADARDRRRVMLATQTILMSISALLAASAWAGVTNVFVLYAAVAAAAATTAFDNPTRSALVPSLVPVEDLANALSLNIVSWQTATVIGPSLAGVIIASYGVGTVYLVDAVSFLAVLAAVWRITPRPRDGGAIRPGKGAIREGLAFVFGTPIMRATMVLDFLATFFGQSMQLMPFFANDVLHVGPVGLGLLYSAPAAGAVIAGAVLSLVGRIRRFGAIILASIAVYGAATLTFGLSRWLPISLLALACSGAADSVSTVARQTIRQLVTPDALRGRMTSVNMIFFMGGPQLGELEAGAVASVLSPSLSVVTGGVGVLVVVAVATLAAPALRRFRDG